MSNIIIDGISNIGKTILLQNIQKRVIKDGGYRYSNFFISEHFTERFFEGKKLT